MKTRKVILFLLCMHGFNMKAGEPPQMPPAPIETYTIIQKEVIHGVTSNGELRANRSVIIKSEIPGQIAYLNLSEGKKIEKGTLLVELSNIGAKANLNHAKAKQSHSKLRFERLKTLAQKGTASQSEKDEAHANMKMDEASVLLAQSQLEKSRMLAPFSGTLGLRQVDMGDYIEPGQALIELDDISNLLVDFRVPEKYLNQLRVGQSIEITLEALSGKVFIGEIYAIAPQIDSMTRTLQARAKLPNPEGLLRPGLFAKIKIVFERNKNAILVPEQALFMAQNKNYVYRIVNQKAHLTEVSTGVRENGSVEILNGLKPKDVIAKSGHMRLFDGAQVFLPSQK